MRARVIVGNVRDVLPTLPAESVQTVVTSPPYFGLRDYGVAGQIGLEQTPDEYVAQLVAVFRDVRRVLRQDGTVWLNLGDSYASKWPCNRRNVVGSGSLENGKREARPERMGAGLKEKDLIGIPWRVAFALQADGWWLRSDIVWSKPNPMPESVTDRPTKSHEYIFLLTKDARYFYDADAIREPAEYGRRTNPNAAPMAGRSAQSSAMWRNAGTGNVAVERGHDQSAALYDPDTGRNKRSVWTVATQPFSEAHFATFPEALIEPCILAGTSERGGCPACGAPWRRVTGRDEQPQAYADGKYDRSDPRFATKRNMGARYQKQLDEHPMLTLGWEPTCRCDAGEPTPQMVLDPFSGSGTTGVVALRHGREYVGVELNREYAVMSERRIFAAAPLFNRVTLETERIA